MTKNFTTFRLAPGVKHQPEDAELLARYNAAVKVVANGSPVTTRYILEGFVGFGFLVNGTGQTFARLLDLLKTHAERAGIDINAASAAKGFLLTGSQPPERPAQKFILLSEHRKGPHHA